MKATHIPQLLGQDFFGLIGRLLSRPERLIGPATIFMAILLGYYLVHSPNLAMFIAAFPLILLLYTRPKTAVYLIALNFLLIDWLTIYGLPHRFTWLQEYALLTLFFRMLLQRLFRNEADIYNILALPVGIFLVYLVADGPVRGVYPVQWLLGLRFHYKFLFLHLAIFWLGLPEQDVRKMLRFLYAFMMLQIPVSLLQAAVYGGGQGGDFCHGTFPLNNTNHLGLFLVAVIIGTYGYYSFGLISRRAAIAATGLMVPLLLAWSRFSILMFPIMLALMLLINPTFALTRRLRTLLTVGLFFFLMLWVSQFFLRQSYLGFFIDLEGMYEVHSRDPFKLYGDYYQGGVGRIRSFHFVQEILNYDYENGLLFGTGLGNATESVFGRQYSGKAYLLHNPRAGFKGSQLPWTLMEIGWVGFGLNALIYAVAFVMSNRILRRHPSPFWKATALAFCILVALKFSAILYTVVWSSEPLGFLFWVFGAVLAREYHNMRQDKMILIRQERWNSWRFNEMLGRRLKAASTAIYPAREIRR